MNPDPGSPNRARGWRPAALFGVVLALWSGRMYSVPAEPPPTGFAWEDLQEIHASILKPEKWFFRRIIPATPFFNLSPQPFDNAFGVIKGVGIHVMTKTDKPADERAAGRIAQCAERHKVLQGWTKKATPAEPFTTYGLICVIEDEETDGVKCVMEIVAVANHATNTVYQCWLIAPSAQWKDVEQTGETILANLRLDPRF